jgi:hypothetical protein
MRLAGAASAYLPIISSRSFNGFDGCGHGDEEGRFSIVVVVVGHICSRGAVKLLSGVHPW